MNINYQLSKYQENILNFVQNEKGNLLVDAKAGSGKTSTLLLVADILNKQDKNCLFLAFNKSIVEELQNKIEDNNKCLVKTLHSLGLTFLKSYLYRKYKQDYVLNINTNKMRDLVKYFYEQCCMEDVIKANEDSLSLDEIKELHTNYISDLITLCDFCRLYYVNYKDSDAVKHLMFKCCMYIDKHYKDEIINYSEVVCNVLDTNIYQFENPEFNDKGQAIFNIDYTDMIYFPVLYNMNIPYSITGYLDIILVDEVQDLSILQQYFVKLLNTGYNRYIFVGDKKQAIYGFAGADSNSIDKIKQNFLVNELPLNICYRCPEKVIKLAQELVPEIEWNKARSDIGDVGTVNILKYEQVFKVIKPGDILIGRRNKDLLHIFKDFSLNRKIKVKFKNLDIVKSIIKDLDIAIKGYILKYNKRFKCKF